MARTPYNEFAEKWKSKIEVDYFTEFVKTWISFNAWYKMSYPSLNTDRDTIDEIKSTSNNFRDRIMVLIGDVITDDNSKFKNHIGLLHKELERKYIYNKDRRISFEDIIIGNNPKLMSDGNKNGLFYKVERIYNGQRLTNIISYIERSGSIYFNESQTHYSFEELKTRTNYLSLSSTQKSNIEFYYKDIDPRKPVNLLTRQTSNIKFGDYYFIEDRITIAKGLIETLYLIRNTLFHGTIVPDRETNRIYEQAYQILRLIVEEL